MLTVLVLFLYWQFIVYFKKTDVLVKKLCILSLLLPGDFITTSLISVNIFNLWKARYTESTCQGEVVIALCFKRYFLFLFYFFPFHFRLSKG